MKTQEQKVVYKICPTNAWASAVAVGYYSGSDDDRRDGFIHLSTADQLHKTLAKHFAGQSDLLLIALNTSELTDALQWEPSRGGLLFPHYYGNIPMTAVCWTKPLALDENGTTIVPALE